MENPKQVIRYTRDTSPLWLSSKFIPQDGDIPACENCGSEREFEFQVYTYSVSIQSPATIELIQLHLIFLDFTSTVKLFKLG